MGAQSAACRWRRNDSGSTLFLVAAGLVFMLAVSALAIDVVSLYVARNEAQRAADAAALAGASAFVSSGCTTGSGGCVAGGPQEAPATTQATQVAAQNFVGGQAPSSSTIGVSFSYPNNEEPEITVTVYRDKTHSNAMPTFFARMFGFTTANISASATAEAYNPSGGGVDYGESCVRPFFVPNCDEDHPVSDQSPNFATQANTVCGGTTGVPKSGYSIPCPPGVPGTCWPSYFFDPNSSPVGKIVNPGACTWTWTSKNPPYAGYCASTSGVQGEFWALHTLAGPSQWYLIGFTGNSGSALRTYIHTCQPLTYTCGSPLNSANGKKVGPVDQGVNDLINSTGDGPNNGQDLICSDSTNNASAGGIDFGGSTCSNTSGASGPTFFVTGGANNPNSNLVGKTFTSGSSSIVNVVVYDGHQLPPGGGSATIIGFMQGFVVDAQHSATDDEVDMVIMNLGGCGTSGGAGGGPVVDAGGSAVPIRLIHQ